MKKSAPEFTPERDFKNPDDYEKISEGDTLTLLDIKKAIETDSEIYLTNETTGEKISLECPLPDRQKKMILAGGLLKMYK